MHQGEVGVRAAKIAAACFSKLFLSRFHDVACQNLSTDNVLCDHKLARAHTAIRGGGV